MHPGSLTGDAERLQQGHDTILAALRSLQLLGDRRHQQLDVRGL